MYLLYFYVPTSHLENVNQALFNIGLGKFQNYDSCCWISKGLGQFRPLEGSKPFIGKVDGIERVIEHKVEIICPADLKTKAIATLIEAHPYETPAYGLLKMID